jgi:hypothetical protein
MFRRFLSRLSPAFRFPHIASRLAFFALIALLLASVPALSAAADGGGDGSTGFGDQEEEIELEPDPINLTQGGASWHGDDGGITDPGFGDQEDEIELEPDPLVTGAPSWISQLTAYLAGLFTRW